MLDGDRARAALQALVDERGSDCAALSRLLGRNAAYVHQYLNRGSPKRLAERDRRLLREYFGVGGGVGACSDGEQPIAHIAFDPAWLRRVARGRPEQLALIRVAGESMAPTLA